MAKSLRELTSLIIDELSRAAAVGHTGAEKDDRLPLPLMLPVGDGRMFYSNRKAESLIQQVGDVLRDNFGLRSAFSDKDFGNLMRSAFGSALAQADDADAATVLSLVQKTVKQAADPSLLDREHCFACSLFGSDDYGSLTIGPAAFEPRTDWLTRKVSEGYIDKVARRRIMRAWQGEKLRSRMQSRHSRVEGYVLNAVGSSHYICSIPTHGLASHMSLDRAVLAARLALASIALMWTTPSSALDGFNLSFDRTPFTRSSLSFGPDRYVSGGWMQSHRPFGPYISKDGWTAILEAFRGELDVVGEVLRFHLEGPASAARPKLMNMFLHALIWFHEACRERLPLLATVKFAATLDALAGGRGTNAILDLLEVQLGVQKDHALFGDGTTAATAVDEIYSEARSRTVHGTNEKLQRDWSGKRGRAEQISRLCLIRCLAWASEQQDTDDPRAMISVRD